MLNKHQPKISTDTCAVDRAFIAKNQPNHVSHSSICAKTCQEACGICKIAKS